MKLGLGLGLDYYQRRGGLIQVVKSLTQVEAWLAGYGEWHEAPPDDAKLNKWTGIINGHEAVQSEGSKQPTSDGTSVEYDDTDDLLINTTLGSLYGNAVSSAWFAAVVRCDTPSANRGILQFGPASGEFKAQIGSNLIYVRTNAPGGESLSASIDTARHVVVGQISGGSLYGWLDGVSMGSAALSGPVDLDGGDLQIGSHYLQNTPLDGGIYAVLFGTTLTTADRQKLESALATLV